MSSSGFFFIFNLSLLSFLNNQLQIDLFIQFFSFKSNEHFIISFVIMICRRHKILVCAFKLLSSVTIKNILGYANFYAFIHIF